MSTHRSKPQRDSEADPYAPLNDANKASRRKYHLQVCPGASLQGPTDEEIHTAIRSLPGGNRSFAILTKTKSNFMQAAGSSRERFVLEYQEFSRDGHWEHVDTGEVDTETVVQTLCWYANDDDRWRTGNRWRRKRAPEPQTSLPRGKRGKKADPLLRWMFGK